MASIATKKTSVANILANASIDISELKINPTSAIQATDGPVAVLNGNRPLAYLVPAAEWEAICNALEDFELAKIVEERAGEETVIVNLDDLSRTRHRF